MLKKELEARVAELENLLKTERDKNALLQKQVTDGDKIAGKFEQLFNEEEAKTASLRKQLAAANSKYLAQLTHANRRARDDYDHVPYHEDERR